MKTTTRRSYLDRVVHVGDSNQQIGARHTNSNLFAISEHAAARGGLAAGSASAADLSERVVSALQALHADQRVRSGR